MHGSAPLGKRQSLSLGPSRVHYSPPVDTIRKDMISIHVGVLYSLHTHFNIIIHTHTYITPTGCIPFSDYKSVQVLISLMRATILATTTILSP